MQGNRTLLAAPTFVSTRPEQMELIDHRGRARSSRSRRSISTSGSGTAATNIIPSSRAFTVLEDLDPDEGISLPSALRPAPRASPAYIRPSMPRHRNADPRLRAHHGGGGPLSRLRARRRRPQASSNGVGCAAPRALLRHECCFRTRGIRSLLGTSRPTATPRRR